MKPAPGYIQPRKIGLCIDKDIECIAMEIGAVRVTRESLKTGGTASTPADYQGGTQQGFRFMPVPIPLE
jgi:hypothetical protein